MKWEIRKVKEGSDKGKWGVFLMQEFCKTEEPVCYGVSCTKKSASQSVKRMNNPDYWIE